MKPAGLVVVEKFVGRHPLLLSLSALSVSFAIEILQAWPAMIPLGHELGEVARNLGYGVAAAFAFNWIMIEVPRKREERRVLDAYWIQLSTMASAAGALMDHYRWLAPEGDYDTRTWAGIKELMEATPVINASTREPITEEDTENEAPTDVFAGSGIHSSVEQAGRLISPFIHRLKPDLADAVTELTHLAEKLDSRRQVPIVFESNRRSMGAALMGLRPFIKASLRVREMLIQHYPNRRIEQTFGGGEEPRLVAIGREEYRDHDLRYL